MGPLCGVMGCREVGWWCHESGGSVPSRQVQNLLELSLLALPPSLFGLEAALLPPCLSQALAV